ncbi:unnamed protein product [Rhizophagus irregularis]|nr:unnamed protein product [Rhizophagus irregularis]
MFCTIFFDIFNINPENFQVSVQVSKKPSENNTINCADNDERDIEFFNNQEIDLNDVENENYNNEDEMGYYLIEENDNTENTDSDKNSE